MKAFIIFSALLSVALAADGVCYKAVVQACKPNSKVGNKDVIGDDECSARYGGAEVAVPSLQTYVNTLITRSFEYLLMSTHFGNYEKNRDGFEHLFKDLSDSKWDQAIDVMKYITKRGGRMNFAQVKDRRTIAESKAYELYELESMAKALDMEKELATDVFNIHAEVSHKNPNSHDPEVANYLEEEFMHGQADTIRKLSGYTSDLFDLIKSPDKSLGIFYFDELLQKS